MNKFWNWIKKLYSHEEAKVKPQPMKKRDPVDDIVIFLPGTTAFRGRIMGVHGDSIRKPSGYYRNHDDLYSYGQPPMPAGGPNKRHKTTTEVQITEVAILAVVAQMDRGSETTDRTNNNRA